MHCLKKKKKRSINNINFRVFILPLEKQINFNRVGQVGRFVPNHGLQPTTRQPIDYGTIKVPVAAPIILPVNRAFLLSYSAYFQTILNSKK